MIEISGKIPSMLNDRLQNMNVIINDVIVGGDDIDVIFTRNGVQTTLNAVYVGNRKWNVDEIDDAINLFPELDEGDTFGLDAVTKLFINSINSSLILSWNPLGKIKYGIRDIGKGIARAANKVADWAADRLYAEDAENWIRENGPYERTFTDRRDGKTRSKKDYTAPNINVGSVESLGKMGHYKVLTGNPDTKDFQVWHLYKNGNQIKCLKVDTGLVADEAQWVYDNNIPKTWTVDDWNPTGEKPKDPDEVAVDETQQEQLDEEVEEDNVIDTASDETVEEDNVIENEEPDISEESVSEDEVIEEDNVTDSNPQFEFEGKGKNMESGVTEDGVQWNVVDDEEDNVVELKDRKKKIGASLIKSEEDFDLPEDEEDNVIDSSLILSTGQGGETEGPDATESEPEYEEDNVIDSTKKKSGYNGCNVTGTTEADGTVVMASFNIFSTLEDFVKFVNADRKKEFSDKVKNIIKDLSARLSKIPLPLRKKITYESNNNLMLNFNGTKVGGYTATIDFHSDGINIVAPQFSELTQEQLLEMIQNDLNELASGNSSTQTTARPHP